MPETPIAAIVPNISGQEAAFAGASAATFTATDRQIIKERVGEIDRKRSFAEIMKEKPLMPEVENSDISVRPETTVTEVEGRLEEHRRMLKHSIVYNPQDGVEINGELPDSFEENPELVFEPEDANVSRIVEKTIAIAKELKLDAAELFDKFALEQKDLFSLIYRVKSLHLKRLLSEKQEEFEKLTDQIKASTIAAAKPEARAWLENQLDQLTLGAAEYKLRLTKTMQKMEFIKERGSMINWLERTISALAKA